MNNEMYTDTLRRLREVVKRKRHEKWRTNNLVFFRDNGPAHRSVLVQDFLAKKNLATLEHPPHSPDLAPADFYLYARLKSTLKGLRFGDATDIIKNATEKQEGLLQNGFQKCFQYLYRP
jgi:histone-lysine N-methyltransferase SETMAR